MKRSAWRPGRSTYVIIGAILVSAAILYYFYSKNRAPGSDTETPAVSPLMTSEALRAQADRLYDRAMTELASGDTSEAKAVIPIALRAYEDAGDLDADGMYHAVVLLTVMGAYDQARDAADQVLTEIPNHLLVLAAAARAARLQADTAAAREYYQRFLAAYDPQRLSDNSPDPHGHRIALPDLKAEAESFAGPPGRKDPP